MVTSTQLLSYLSSDAPIQIFGAELCLEWMWCTMVWEMFPCRSSVQSYVWSGCGVPWSGRCSHADLQCSGLGDVPMQIFGAKLCLEWMWCTMVWGRTWAGLRGCWSRADGFHLADSLFFTSSIHVLMSPALWVAVNVTVCDKAGDFCVDGIKR